ncbi:uncharacterized protein V1518DRAFT_425549 [Limtongia smithiae]|uniref:uncharacterized protein n=1 Tax=Limtongia smithiae TaxID=1125753 RepID=UPI0034CF0251
MAGLSPGLGITGAPTELLSRVTTDGNIGLVQDDLLDIGGIARTSDELTGLPNIHLPADIPLSLDYATIPLSEPQTELTDTDVYDPWATVHGALDAIPVAASPALSSSAAMQPVESASLSRRAEEPGDEDDERARENTRRIQRMLSSTKLEPAADADSTVSVEEVLRDPTTVRDEKSQILQHMLISAASSGDTGRVSRILEQSDARSYVDVNKPDEDGTTALILAACFGHPEIVRDLVASGANVDQQDKFKWSPLMWATNNNHTDIVRFLLDNGASRNVKSAAGRTARDFADQGGSTEMRNLIGSGVELKDESIPAEGFMGMNNTARDMAAETETRRRLLAESTAALNIDLSGFDGENEDELEQDDSETEFDWDHCLPDQMFVFANEDIPRILDTAITKMHPLRSPLQKPVPANVLFLCVRFAHYYGTQDLLESLLFRALERINDAVETHEDDMTYLAFWLSNTTILMYYLRRDAGVMAATTMQQQSLTELISEIFVLLIRDGERRLDDVLDAAILDHETIPGLQDIQFQREWPFFRTGKLGSDRSKSPTASGWGESIAGGDGSSSTSAPGGGSDLTSVSSMGRGPDLEQVRPPSPHTLAKPAPRSVTSLLSSTLFVLDLYEVHPVMVLQVIGQIFYWLDATLFNRIMENRKYLARARAMQIRLNISAVEDWARVNNRRPVELEGIGGSGAGMIHESIWELVRRHLSPVVQLLQWLQCLSGLGDDTEGLIMTVQQLPCLSAEQLMHVVKRYRPEVGEDRMAKAGVKYLRGLEQQQQQQRNSGNGLAGGFSLRQKALRQTQHTRTESEESEFSTVPIGLAGESEAMRGKENGAPKRTSTFGNILQSGKNAVAATTGAGKRPSLSDEELQQQQQQQQIRQPVHTSGIYQDISLILPFVLPTSTEMLVTWGAGVGGTNRAQARKHAPVLPAEFVMQLDAASSLSTGVPSVRSSIVGQGSGGGWVGGHERIRGNSGTDSRLWKRESKASSTLEHQEIDAASVVSHAAGEHDENDTGNDAGGDDAPDADVQAGDGDGIDDDDDAGQQQQHDEDFYGATPGSKQATVLGHTSVLERQLVKESELERVEQEDENMNGEWY